MLNTYNNETPEETQLSVKGLLEVYGHHLAPIVRLWKSVSKQLEIAFLN